MPIFWVPGCHQAASNTRPVGCAWLAQSILSRFLRHEVFVPVWVLYVNAQLPCGASMQGGDRINFWEVVLISIWGGTHATDHGLSRGSTHGGPYLKSCLLTGVLKSRDEWVYAANNSCCNGVVTLRQLEFSGNICTCCVYLRKTEVMQSIHTYCCFHK